MAKRKSPKSLRPVKEIAATIEDGYGAQEIPIFGYLALMGTYAAVFGGLTYLSTRNGRELRKPKGLDLALLTIASYKLSRVVTMSFIGAPVRAPFTERGESLRGGEVQDVARGEGLQRAIGSLVTCPFCFSVWSTTAFMFGYTLVPRATMRNPCVISGIDGVA